MSKKSACGGLFRQKLKKCLRPRAQTPRPPGKAGRYEFTLEDLRVLQTSPNGLFDSLRPPPQGRRAFFVLPAPRKKFLFIDKKDFFDRKNFFRPSASIKGPAPSGTAPFFSASRPHARKRRKQKKRFERPSGARNAPRCTHPRAPPGPAPAPAVGRFGGASRPLRMHSYRPASPGGRGVCAKGANIPYAASRPGALRRRARGKRRNPGGKDRRQPSFSDAR